MKAPPDPPTFKYPTARRAFAAAVYGVVNALVYAVFEEAQRVAS
jgi:hypothetical protein